MKMKMKLFFQITIHAFGMVILSTPSVLGQPQVSDISNYDPATGWFDFHPGVRIEPESLFQIFQVELGLTGADRFQLVRVWTDEISMTHYLFQQYHAETPVHFGTVLIHEKGGELLTMHGQIVAGLCPSPQPAFGPVEAVGRSIEVTGRKVVGWQSDPSLYSQPELLYARKDRAKSFSPENMRLAYRTKIFPTDLSDPVEVFLDASSGQLLYLEPLVLHCVPGTGVTNYYGTQNIEVGPISSGYRLYDCTRNIHTRTNQAINPEVISTTTAFGANTVNPNGAHWCAEQVHDYFLNTHNRNSFDGAGAQMQLFVGGPQNNAQWSIGGFASFFDGDGVTSKSWVTLDIVGHEFTHGVIQYAGGGGLSNTYESGALAESFCDIFGSLVEFSALGLGGDYFFAEDCYIPDGMLRNLMDPKYKGHPDTYKGINWQTNPTPWDHGGIHTNCGVSNHWFYLLTEGSGLTDGVNDNGDIFTVTGIGRANAAAIAYRALDVYFTPATDFKGARAATIQAAKDLFGANSFEVCQVANAWYAVGVGKDDLMIRDNLADTGVEPSNGVNMFLAYDIWVRKQPDNLNSGTGQYQYQYQSEDLMATVGPNPSYVYVKIHNIGNAKSECGTLRLYWSRASTGLTWPVHWNNFTCPSGGAICGDQFTDCSGAPISYEIPSIPAGGEHTIEIMWCPPDPALLPGTGNPVDDMHFCLLARIERENDPMHDELNNVSCNYNTWQNNNIAWKNIRIQPSDGVYVANPDGMLVRTRRIVDNGQPVRFRIQDESQVPFLEKGDILLQLPDSLFSFWVQGGMQGAGFEPVGPQVLKLINATAYLDGIHMPFGQDYSIGLIFNPFEGWPIEVPATYLATIVQMEKSTPDGPHEVVGGEGFEFRVNPYLIWAGNDITICTGDSAILTADLSNWVQNDSTFVFWDSGETGVSIVVSPESTQTYTVIVTNGDGFFAESSVNVYVNQSVAWYLDADGDGFGSEQTAYYCNPPAGYVDNSLDCNDQSSSIYPGAMEVCNDFDDDCNDLADDNTGFDCDSLSTGIKPENSLSGEFRLYPNPVWDYISIEWAGEGEDQEFQIIDLAGRILRTAALPENKTTVSVPVFDLAPGIYFFKIRTEKGIFFAGKLTKQ